MSNDKKNSSNAQWKNCSTVTFEVPGHKIRVSELKCCGNVTLDLITDY